MMLKFRCKNLITAFTYAVESLDQTVVIQIENVLLFQNSEILFLDVYLRWTIHHTHVVCLHNTVSFYIVNTDNYGQWFFLLLMGLVKRAIPSRQNSYFFQLQLFITLFKTAFLVLTSRFFCLIACFFSAKITNHSGDGPIMKSWKESLTVA